jgi:cytidylate kinase
MIVAIDGPAGSGKSAVGRRVASALGLPFVDSGLMYRAIAWLAADRGIGYEDDPALTGLAGRTRITIDGPRVHVDGEDLTGQVYNPQASEGASRVAQVGGVREALVRQQRRLGDGGVVMAGRDIGTVVFPDTPYKFFLTASVGERARRRDAGRAISPMRPAEDAQSVATDGLDLQQVVEVVLDAVRSRA